MKSVTIRIESADSGYKVSLFDGAPPVAGQGLLAGAVRQALGADELRAAVLNGLGDAEEIGIKLGDFLFAGPIWDAWKSAAKGASIRTYLDCQAAGLAGAPWEFARFDQSALFLRGGWPFVVFQGREAPAREREWGLRVLVVIAAEDPGDTIGIWREVYAIRNAIREVNRVIDMMPLKHPSRDALKQAVGNYRPHVLHLIGHGNSNGLLLYDGTESKPWGALQIDTDLAAWKWMPEVVYLNTCRSVGDPQNRLAKRDLDPAARQKQWTAVDKFLQYGTVAVIAMQADVQGGLAGACAAEFYKGIAAGSEIDAALAAGRGAVAAIQQEDSLDPYLPKLIVTRPVEEILRYRAELTDCPDFAASLKTFVDRDEQRRRLVDLLEHRQPVVVVVGPKDIGKTWLLQWCIDAWRRRKMETRYVAIGGCRNWLDVVRAIRDGIAGFRNQPESVLRGLGARAQALLNWRLNALAQGVADPPTDSFTGTEKEDVARTRYLVEQPMAIIEPHVKGMAALHAVLQEEAGAQPLVIVLDNFVAGDQGLTEGYFGVLQSHWLDSLVVPPGGSNIRVVLGLGSDQIKEYNLETMPAGYSKVDLGFFPKEEFAEIVLDLLPLEYPLGDKRDRALAWVRKLMVDFDPEYDGQLSGPKLRQRCKEIGGVCMAKRKEWETQEP